MIMITFSSNAKVKIRCMTAMHDCLQIDNVSCPLALEFLIPLRPKESTGSVGQDKVAITNLHIDVCSLRLSSDERSNVCEVGSLKYASKTLKFLLAHIMYSMYVPMYICM